MARLRTDLPLMADDEVDDWIGVILENTHYRDIMTLRMKLDEAIESHNTEITDELKKDWK